MVRTLPEHGADGFPLPEVGEAYNKHFVCLKIDAEKGEGKELAKKYGVHSYPSYIFVEPKTGDMIHRSGGNKPAADFIADIKGALNPKLSSIYLAEKYKGGKYDDKFLIDYIRGQKTSGNRNVEKDFERLLGMALYGKNINKAAVRDVLMDYTEVADRLMSMYSGASAHDRVAIVRLLCAFKNDGVVHEFLRETVARDKSKSVREAAQAGIKTARIKNAAAYLENAMAEGVAHTVTEWTELLSDPKLGEVADRIFFTCPHPTAARACLFTTTARYWAATTDL